MFDYKNKFTIEAFIAWNMTITAILAVIFFSVGAFISGKEGALYLEVTIGAIAAIFGMFWRWRKAVMDRKEKELLRQREIFEKVNTYYLFYSDQYALEANNVFCLLDEWETEIWYEGRNYVVSVSNVTKEIDYPSVSEDYVYNFIINYPSLYQLFIELKRSLDSLKVIEDGGCNDMGCLTPSAREKIKIEYNYFMKVKSEIEQSFSQIAKDLGVL